MRRFFLYPGSHDKLTDCLLSRWSADAPPVITKGGWSSCRARQPGGQLPNCPRSVHCAPLTGGRGVAAYGVRASCAAAARRQQRWRRPTVPEPLCWTRICQFGPPCSHCESSSTAMVCARAKSLLGQPKFGRLGVYMTCSALSHRWFRAVLPLDHVQKANGYTRGVNILHYKYVV